VETLNKNWFPFTLLAIVFGLLAYLLGQRNNLYMKNKIHMQEKKMEAVIMKKYVDKEEGNFIWMMDEELYSDDMSIKVYRDTTEENGEIRVQVKKIIKKEL
tara:strand:- start:502 stop:804 length:303 start_codon:yes stop_codon:yes gene_type:complete